MHAFNSRFFPEVWTEVYRQVWECKAERGLLRDDIIVGSYLSRQDNVDPLRLAGLSLDGVSFLLEQLPSAKFCSRYKFKFFNLKVQHIPVNPSGCARSEVNVTSSYTFKNWLSVTKTMTINFVFSRRFY